MRLLNARTRKLEEFASECCPRYAILSHTWARDEVAFDDFKHPWKARRKTGYQKIRLVCKQALNDGLAYVWVDTCCIDKSSSAELSESINSMWRFYSNAARCYAYLPDVPGHYLDAGHRFSHVDTIKKSPSWMSRLNGHRSSITLDPSLEGGHEKYAAKNALVEEGFRKSRWFTRGWTLQELIAPDNVSFYGDGWGYIGSRNENLLSLICDITSIPHGVFTFPEHLPYISIARRLSWAANRKTVRVEDEAYCLLGLFNVNMPMLYGEGRKAFVRLQEEIIKTSTDHSVFAWTTYGLGRDADLLAIWPKAFRNCGRIRPFDLGLRPESYSLTNRGLRITLPVMPDPEVDSTGHNFIAVLNCRDNEQALALKLQSPGTVGNFEMGAEFAIRSSRLLKVPIEWANEKKCTITILPTEGRLGLLRANLVFGEHNFENGSVADSWG